MIGWLIALVIGVLIAMVLISLVEVKIRIKRIGQDDRILINVRWLYGLVRYSMKIPKMKFKGAEGVQVRQKVTDEQHHEVMAKQTHRVDEELIKKDYRRLMRLLRNTFELSKWLKETLSHIRCVELNWQSDIGAGEAVETATLTGLAWSVKGSLVGYLSNHIKLQVQPRLWITPHFNQMRFATQFNCILNIRTGYAIVAGLLLLVRILRIKGGIKTWQNILSKV